MGADGPGPWRTVLAWRTLHEASLQEARLAVGDDGNAAGDQTVTEGDSISRVCQQGDLTIFGDSISMPTALQDQSQLACDEEVTAKFHVTFDEGDGDRPGVMRIEAQYPYTTPFEATQWLDACRQALVAELVKRGTFWQ